jgi:hypothetical protein
MNEKYRFSLKGVKCSVKYNGNYFRKIESKLRNNYLQYHATLYKYFYYFVRHRKNFIKYSRNVIDVDWVLVVKLALPGKVTRRVYKVCGIYDRFLTNVQFNHKF